MWGEKNVEAIKQKVGEQDTVYGAAINNLGVFYFLSGNYTRAKPLYVKSADIIKLNYGENSQQFAISLNNLARFYDVTGDYSSSELISSASSAISARTLTPSGNTSQ